MTPRDYNRFSATVSGPIFRNRTFFMGSYEKLQDDTIETVTNSVPTERMRRGDFSELLAIGVQIFDPATARLVNGVVTRDPFPGTSFPTTASIPSPRSVLNYFPAPNQAPQADLSNNLCRAAVDLRLQPAADADRSRMDAAASDLWAIHPQLPARRTLQLRW